MPVLFYKEQAVLPLVTQVSQNTGVPVALILGHMKRESSFNPNAYRAEPKINDASYGLMQVLLSTAKTIDASATPDKLYDPNFNVPIGAKYIAQNLTRYPNNIQDAIAAYNAGSAYKDAKGNYVSQSGKDVQGYVDAVYKNYVTYSTWLNNGANIVDPSLIDMGSIALFFAMGAAFIFVMGKYAKNHRRKIRK